VTFFADITGWNIRDAHQLGSFVVVGRDEWIRDLVRPWAKKPFLYLLPYPLPPIQLVVVAVSQEHESRMLVVEVVVTFSRL